MQSRHSHIRLHHPSSNQCNVCTLSLLCAGCGFLASVYKGSVFFPHFTSSPVHPFCWCRDYSLTPDLHPQKNVSIKYVRAVQSQQSLRENLSSRPGHYHQPRCKKRYLGHFCFRETALFRTVSASRTRRTTVYGTHRCRWSELWTDVQVKNQSSVLNPGSLRVTGKEKREKNKSVETLQKTSCLFIKINPSWNSAKTLSSQVSSKARDWLSRRM